MTFFMESANEMFEHQQPTSQVVVKPIVKKHNGGGNFNIDLIVIIRCSIIFLNVRLPYVPTKERRKQNK